MDRRIPFEVKKTESFYDKLTKWIGDVFYDVLPEAGFELRDEQIYMAFQLEKAFEDKKIIFAEAGVGTGKTIVYLLYAIMYARLSNRPAIIACADETLIEQLVKQKGDIAKLENILGLTIDVRLAKSQDQYLCLKKLENVRYADQTISALYEQLPDFVHHNKSMLNYKKYGDRREYPDLSDETWEKISWDQLQDCFSCEKRHRCGLTLNREYYRQATDLIICSHDFFMEHIWTKESRKREGQLPLIPEHSAVVFDEGHLLEYAAQKALSYRFTDYTLETLLIRLMENEVREKTLYTIEDALLQNTVFFDSVANFSSNTATSEKQMIVRHPLVIKNCRKLLALLQQLEEELVFESELFVISEYELKIVEEYLDQMTFSLALFLQESNGITWFEERDGERTLVIMPKLVEDVLREDVFKQKKPYIFSSATLSSEKSFDYFAASLGISDYLAFSVDSPFDYDEKMKIYLAKFYSKKKVDKLNYLISKILQAEGRALILVNNEEEMGQLRASLPEHLPYPVYFEGDEEISTLVSKFQNNEHSILCSIHLWEGLDVPGSSLENVFIYSLPFPPDDPVFVAKREGTANPVAEVDLPYMLLRLRQGVGRLIRTENDHGTVHLLINQDLDPVILQKIKDVLPTQVIENISK